MKLYVFDFDGTLGNSPSPSLENKALYKERTGNDWPFQGWWGRIESMKDFEFGLIEDQAKVAIDKTKTDLVYILTSRLPKFKEIIQKVCIDNGLDISIENILTKRNEEKGERLFQLAYKHLDDIDEIIFYDDRQKEIDSALQWRSEIEKIGIKLTTIKIQSDALD